MLKKLIISILIYMIYKLIKEYVKYRKIKKGVR